MKSSCHSCSLHLSTAPSLIRSTKEGQVSQHRHLHSTLSIYPLIRLSAQSICPYPGIITTAIPHPLPPFPSSFPSLYIDFAGVFSVEELGPKHGDFLTKLQLLTYAMHISKIGQVFTFPSISPSTFHPPPKTQHLPLASCLSRPCQLLD